MREEVGPWVGRSCASNTIPVACRHGPLLIDHAGAGKIQADAERAKPHFTDLQILVFVTSGKVTNFTAEKWQADIKKEYGWDLS